jgi:hypothetical protein
MGRPGRPFIARAFARRAEVAALDAAAIVSSLMLRLG